MTSNDLYAGGSFYWFVGNNDKPAGYISKFNGSGWEFMKNGLSYNVHTLKMSPDNKILYVGKITNSK